MSLLPHHRILATAAICLVAGVNSCIYSDLGRTIGSIGTEVPRIVPQAARGNMCSYCGDLYRKEGRYYVALPLAWVPERRRGYEYFPLFTPREASPFCSFLTYNRPYTAEELKRYPTTPEYYEAANPRIVSFSQADANGAVGYVCADLTPVESFDPQGAEALGRYGVAGAAHRIEHLEKRHAWYHYPLLPLQAVAALADVPLSAVLMPLSFPVFWMEEITGSDWQAIEPWYDDTRPTFAGPWHPEYETGISPPETLAGKRLILGDKCFDFPRDADRSYAHRGKSYSYEYRCADPTLSPLSQFYEYQPDTQAFRRWELLFITPDSGVAVSQLWNAKDYLKGKLSPLKPGVLIQRPFRIETLAP